MAVANGNAAADGGNKVNHKKLNEDLSRLFDSIEKGVDGHELEGFSEENHAAYKAMLKCGIQCLMGTVSIASSQVWDDAMTYSREVILAPQDSERRASSPWIRSCSDLYKELTKRFGPETIEAARLGSSSIIENHYGGDRRAIAHVNKKASYLRHCHEGKVGAAFYPQDNPLAAGCYQSGTLPCSLALSAFLPVEESVLAAYVSHPSVCDDYGSFTQAAYEVRLRLVALSAGAAYRHGGKTMNGLVDGTALQAVGTNTATPRSIEAAMAWRSVSGATTSYSKYNFEGCDLEDGLVGPMAMIATHDLFDWRSDTAAGNYENGVSAVHGFGIEAPFHTYLEAMLEKVLLSPRSGLYAAGSVVYMHFTVGRYGAWEYHGRHGPACDRCVGLLRSATQGAGLEWTPKAPPQNYAEGDEPREWGKIWSDQLVDKGLMQEAVSWFQYLVTSGRMWLFDLLADGALAVDEDTDWA